ncbi:MAG: GNAT family N-acetyltransferase [Steroidobacteraceae bacterium]
MLSGLSVTSIAGVAALERFAADIDRLNALSSRCNPFLSAAFLRCYALRAEYHVPGDEERLYLIWEGERLVGIAPLRRSIENVGAGIRPLNWRGVRLTVLAPLDTERPGILSAPEDEARVAAMLINHLCTCERDWGLLEFAGQLPGTPLYEAVHAATNGTFRARDIAVEPYTEIAVVWDDQATYFRSLAKKMRSNISRQARRLFAHGQVEIVLAEGPPAATAWFDAYCDLDSRSWKNGTPSSIQRHPRRVRFYREIAAGRAGLEPSFIGILLDGVLIAGLLNGSNTTAAPGRQGTWCLEMAYDESRADLGPGQLLLLLAMGEAIRRGDRFLSFMQNFAYYKQRWGATQIPVVNVQLLRRASLHSVRARVGEWRKRLAAKRAASAEAADGAGSSESTGAAGRAAVSDTENSAAERNGVLPDLTRARELTAAALAFDGAGIRRLQRQEAAVYLPFAIE